MPRLSLALVLFAALAARAEDPDKAPLNFESMRGKAPKPMPAPAPWPDAKAFESGATGAFPFLQVEGYAHRKQRCTCLDVFSKPDGSLEARRLVYYRVGTFEDGAAAFEADLENGVILALKVDMDVPAPDVQDAADVAVPSTWHPNVKAAWFGAAGAKPKEIKVAARTDDVAGPKDARVIYHRATNTVVTGNFSIVCEAKLNWSGLIEIADVYASDPIQPKPVPGKMGLPRAGSTGVVLADGRVLIAGGWIDRKPESTAEIFDPSTGTFTKTGSCHSVHGKHSMSVCGDGRVLLVPGYGAPLDERRPELFDAKTGTWALAPATARSCYCPVSITLADGRVLVYDGSYDAGDRAAEIFDPKTNAWSLTPGVAAVDTTTTLTRLKDGRVLLIGRGGPLGLNQPGESIARFYDPAKNIWTVAPAPADVRSGHTATLLQDGRVLVAGGASSGIFAEIYDPVDNDWTPTDKSATSRSGHAAALLPDGRLLVIGGSFPVPSPPDLPVGEIYDPKTGRWTGAAKDAEILGSPAAYGLKDGSVLVVSNAGRVAWFTVKK